MPSDHIMRISQGQNKTLEVLKWIGRNPGNTVEKLLQILVIMRRFDCVEIIEENSFCSEWEHRVRTSREGKFYFLNYKYVYAINNPSPVSRFSILCFA